jgi:uncharacterized protein
VLRAPDATRAPARPRRLCLRPGRFRGDNWDDSASSHVPSAPIGPVIETFAAMQLVRQLPWSQQRPTLWHFRDRSGKEVDLILEHPDDRIVGVEVTASSTITARDFRGLNFLKERLGERFAYGVVLHTANEALTFGDRLAALPLSALWSDR